MKAVSQSLLAQPCPDLKAIRKAASARNPKEIQAWSRICDGTLAARFLANRTLANRFLATRLNSYPLHQLRFHFFANERTSDTMFQISSGFARSPSGGMLSPLPFWMM